MTTLPAEAELPSVPLYAPADVLPPPEPTPRWRVPLGAITCVLFLLAFELGVARQDWFWAWVGLSQAGVIDALEDKVIAGAEPKILFIGSSRVRDAIAPRIVEQELGLPTGSVLNLGLTMGTPWDTAMLYRRNRDVLKQAKLAFFGVEPFQFDRTEPPTERMLRWGTLDDRVNAFAHTKTPRSRIVAGYVWRTLETGPAMERFAKALWKGRPEPPISADGRVEWRQRRDNNAALRRAVESDANRFFKRWRSSRWHTRQLTKLLAMLEADGIEVVVIQVPARKTYWDYVMQRYPKKLRRYAEGVRKASAGHPVWLYWEGDTQGIADSSFYDYGHMKSRPAQRYSRLFARYIREDFAELLGIPPAPPSNPPAPRGTSELPGVTNPPEAPPGQRS